MAEAATVYDAARAKVSVVDARAVLCVKAATRGAGEGWARRRGARVALGSLQGDASGNVRLRFADNMDFAMVGGAGAPRGCLRLRLVDSHFLGKGGGA